MIMACSIIRRKICSFNWPRYSWSFDILEYFMPDGKDIITWLGISYLLYGMLSFNQRFIYKSMYLSTISMQQYVFVRKVS